MGISPGQAILGPVTLTHGKRSPLNWKLKLIAEIAPGEHVEIDVATWERPQEVSLAPVARRIIGDEPVIGRSTHARDEFDAGQLESGVDYVCAGPTWATPTKPGRPAAGLELLRHAAQLTGPDSRPWFAIGGIESVERLDDVIAAGARRVVVVRAITQAEDPGEMARTFARRLAGVPLSRS